MNIVCFEITPNGISYGSDKEMNFVGVSHVIVTSGGSGEKILVEFTSISNSLRNATVPRQPKAIYEGTNWAISHCATRHQQPNRFHLAKSRY